MNSIKLILFIGVLSIALPVLYLFDPAETHIFPHCIFHELTGLYCPGCGATRAIHQFLHGSFAEAFSLNPLMVIMLPVVILLCLRKKWAYRPWTAWGAFAVLVCYGVMRNIDAWPFMLLAPK